MIKYFHHLILIPFYLQQHYTTYEPFLNLMKKNLIIPIVKVFKYIKFNFKSRYIGNYNNYLMQITRILVVVVF